MIVINSYFQKDESSILAADSIKERLESFRLK